MENIVSSFREIVSRMPDEPAVIFEGKSLTYRELDLQSDGIAAFLTKYQVRSKQVGAAMNRGREWIAALLGIWKAGAVYVPLDLNHPRERLESILTDCEISVVICSRQGGFEPERAAACYVDEMSISGEGTLQLPLPEEDDRAYLIYTSGTSGEPKGIPASHSQAVRMSRLSRDYYFYVHAGERMLQLAGLNFSASLVETLTALLNGVCLVIAGDQERQAPRLLVELIEREHVASAIIPPALLAVFPRVPLACLKTLLVAGEGVSSDVKDYWVKGHRMVNAYGFTENTVLVMSGIYKEDTPPNDIGIPVPGLTAYVLDENLMPVPDGTSGELCVGGRQLTEGYWKRPELNACKFIKNPFLAVNGSETDCPLRLYRSGDRVTRLPNGHFLYLGRLDHQIKIRGMRIELAEIEQCLNRYPGVSMSVVVPKEYRGRKMLIAYLQAEQEIDRDKIAAFIAEKLPDYMCPAYYVTLKKFPMTINRKIDKNQLPEPAPRHSGGWKEKPVTSAEKEIARIWQDILGVPDVGRKDNFISLGGDSISILLMTNMVEEEFGITLRAKDVFSRLDLNVLAEWVVQMEPEQRDNAGKVSRHHVYGPCPLSPALRNLWSHCMSSQDMSEAYKLALILPQDSNLKVDILQQAWNRIVEEQEVMRMSFPTGSDGEPYIHVAPFVYTDLPLRTIGESDFWEDVWRFYSRPFSLEKGPLHRACLYRHPNGEYRLVVIIHHLVTDGWSARLLNEKLQNYYRQLSRGEMPVAENISYRDYIMWNKEQLDDLVREERKSFWKDYLSGCFSLSFEGKAPQGPVSKKQGGAKYLPMDKELVEQLEFFCERNAVTPLIVCLSVFQLILMKYSGQSEFVVGLAATDRKRSEFHDLLGYFATLLPVRTIPFDSDGFVWHCKRLMEEVVNLLNYHLPLHEIVDSWEETAGRKPDSSLIRFAFGLEEVASNVTVPEEWISSSPFDMAFVIHTYEGNHSFHLQYATACFDEKFIIQFCDSFQVALRFLLHDPSRPLLECPLLSEEAIARRISSFTFFGFSLPEWNVVERFEEIAACWPNSEAYRQTGFSLSYGGLKILSDRIAADVRKRFACEEKRRRPVPVGIYLREKQYLLPAIMGVLKGGGCYVPLDTSLPVARLAFILEDAAIPLLVVDEVPEAFGMASELLSIRNIQEKDFPADFHPAEPLPEDTAYIIYTSGTTGKPKGIPISHGSLALFARSQSEIYGLLPDKRVLQYASVGFDASIMEIFPALTTGATLVIPTEEERKDPGLLLDLMEREKIYCTLLPPALLSVLPYRALPDLKTLVVGGESTPAEVMERWKQGRRLVNAYGPTENTVVTTCTEVSDVFLSNDIGFPLPGVSCYVLDQTMTLLPDYVPGELYIGGLQLTAGYINREELNRKKFIDNPFAYPADRRAGRNTRLFRSGDRVMRTSDGSLLFLGRIDSQVKMRGFRIEPDEISRQLEEYPGVLHAIVTLKECEGEKQLVAYLLVEEKEKVELERVRHFLMSRLPAYMIPTAWAILDHFPLTINGKVDRNALPEPEPLVTEEYIPPAGKEEETLVKIAGKLLQLPRVGVCSDLFDMGLNSLQVMELVREAQEEKMAISVTDVYKGRDIRHILANKENPLYYWENEAAHEKPVVVLVCGYPYFRPFYDPFVERFKDDYSFFVFESFLEYFRDKEMVCACDLTDYYSGVMEKELHGREIYAVVGHCLGGELGMILAEYLRVNGHPSIKALVIESFVRRDKSLLIPETSGNELLRAQSRITNSVIKTMPEPMFGGEMIVCLATKASDRFMFETELLDSSGLIHAMQTASEKNKADWKCLYPRTTCYELDTDHWGVFDPESLASLYEIVKRNWYSERFYM